MTFPDKPFQNRTCIMRSTYRAALSATQTVGMRVVLLMLLTLLALLLLFPPVLQATESGKASEGRRVLSTETMKDLFRQTVVSNLPWDREDLEIKNFAVNQTDLTIPGGELDYRILSLVPDRFLGRRYLTVVYTVDGRDELKVKMSGDVHRYGNVFCSASYLPRGTVLAREDIITKYRDVTMLGSDLPRIPDQITGKITRTTLQPGEIIHNRDLEKKELVKRGEMVTIVAGDGPLRISVPGEVENRGGARGETVKVKNLMSRRIINARVIGDGTVRAGF